MNESQIEKPVTWTSSLSVIQSTEGFAALSIAKTLLQNLLAPSAVKVVFNDLKCFVASAWLPLKLIPCGRSSMYCRHHLGATIEHFLIKPGRFHSVLPDYKYWRYLLRQTKIHHTI
ncbi:MAG: hypothetical protein ACLR5N_08275 [Haemophilus parainfluenzae]